MRPLLLTRLAVALAALAILPDLCVAQIRASERGSTAQTIDGTTISMDYGRPQVRGRTNLFGGEVPWGKIWTPGANWATTLETSRDITINGHEVTAGRYSLWFEVQPDGWSVIIDPEPRRFHLMPPPVSAEQVRFTVQPTGDAPHTEMLTWSFLAVRPTGGTLRFSWANTRVDFDVGVHPSRPLTVSRDVADRLTGTYKLHLNGPIGNDVVDYRISYEDGHLVGHWPAAPNPRLQTTWLISLGAGMFAPGELDDGALFDIVVDLIFEFPVEGPVTEFELRGPGDVLWGTGART
jgi:hypothetical protein